MLTLEERRVVLRGCYNFRDLGGFQTGDGRVVRRGRFFRSDALHRLTDEDTEALAALGVATLLDLRTHGEIAQVGIGPLRERGVRHRHLPIQENADEPARYDDLPPIGELYVRFLDEGRGGIRAGFAELAEAGTYPAVVHCAAGKDRTGVVVALVLRALGVRDEDVIADYAATDVCMTELIAAMRADGSAPQLDKVPPTLLRALPETMAGFLGRLDERFGSTECYLVEVGVSRTEIERIRELPLDSVTP